MLFRWSLLLSFAVPLPAAAFQTPLSKFEQRCDRQHCWPLDETVESVLAPVLGDVEQVALGVDGGRRVMAQVRPKPEPMVWASKDARDALIRPDKAQAVWRQMDQAVAAIVRFGFCREAY